MSSRVAWIVLYLGYWAVMVPANWRVEQHKCQELGHQWHRDWALRWYGCWLRVGRKRYESEQGFAFWGNYDPDNELCHAQRDCPAPPILGQWMDTPVPGATQGSGPLAPGEQWHLFPGHED